MTKEGAVILLSGGLDSTVSLAWAVKHLPGKHQALSFRYGQSHLKELQSAEKVASHYGIPWKALNVNLDHIKPGEVGTLMWRSQEFSPQDAQRTVKDQHGHDVSATFVPGRNIIFLAYAGSLCDQEGLGNIVLGVNHMDFSGLRQIA